MNDLDAISWGLIALWVVDLLVTALMVVIARHVREPAFTDRAQTSILLTIGAAGPAILAAAQLSRAELPGGPTFILLVAPFVLMSLPQPIWLVSWLVGRFG